MDPDYEKKVNVLRLECTRNGLAIAFVITLHFLGERKGTGCSQYLQYESYETTP